MWLDERYRGTRGILGWLILQWDRYQVGRMYRLLKRLRKERAALIPVWPPLPPSPPETK